MNNFAPIDISRLPPPVVVQQVDPETNVALLKADMIIRLTRDKSFTLDQAETLVNDLSQPITKSLENAAYLASLKQVDFNGKALGLFVAYAEGPELDQLAALIPIERRVLIEADTTANPPVLEELESDDEFRQRIRLAPLGFSTAGSKGGYEFHAISGSANIKDAEAFSPAPNEVSVVILSRLGNGTPDDATCQSAKDALNEEFIRPIGDLVTIVPATITEYDVDATLTLGTGPDAGNVLENVQNMLRDYGRRQHRIGATIHISKLIAILGQEGVENVSINNLNSDIVGTQTSAPFLNNITIRTA